MPRDFDNTKPPVFHQDGTLPTDEHQIFVFGSNLAGIHGAGAAKAATTKYGAEWGVGWGRTGRAYAIPTKGYMLEVLNLHDIKVYVDRFIQHANDGFLVNHKFFVTRVGCGLAGYRDEHIAPMFRGAYNCSFAEEWRPYLT